MKRMRVVVTGMGVISPVGLDVPTMWENVVAGRSGIAPVTLFDTSDYGVHFAGEAHGFDPCDYMSVKEARRADRFAQYSSRARPDGKGASRPCYGNGGPWLITEIRARALMPAGVVQWNFTVLEPAARAGILPRG